MSHAWSGRRIRPRSLLAALLLRRKLVAGSRGESGEACRQPWRCDDTEPQLADFVQTCLASRGFLKAPLGLALAWNVYPTLYGIHTVSKLGAKPRVANRHTL